MRCFRSPVLSRAKVNQPIIRVCDASRPLTRCRDSRLRCSWQRDRDARARGRVQRAMSDPVWDFDPKKAVTDERFPPAVDQIPELIEHAGLLQCNFAHELGADDLANIEAFHLNRLLLI